MPAIWLAASGQLLNPAFLAAVGDVEIIALAGILPAMIAWIIAVVSVVDICEGWWKALRT